jgi:two-component sensor histidine kinase
VDDDGIGLPPAFDVAGSETLGLQLVAGLVQQIDGSLTVDRGEPGARFTVVFPQERAR